MIHTACATTVPTMVGKTAALWETCRQAEYVAKSSFEGIVRWSHLCYCLGEYTPQSGVFNIRHLGIFRRVFCLYWNKLTLRSHNAIPLISCAIWLSYLTSQLALDYFNMQMKRRERLISILYPMRTFQVKLSFFETQFHICGQSSMLSL